VCADGATSKMATKLGIVKSPPSSQCSRAYVEGGSHCFKADGVVFWNRDVLPGQKHSNHLRGFMTFMSIFLILFITLLSNFHQCIQL